jgi:hypothetical protein
VGLLGFTISHDSYCGIDPLLGKDLETVNETTAVVMQRDGKHASTIVTVGNGVSNSVRAKWL